MLINHLYNALAAVNFTFVQPDLEVVLQHDDLGIHSELVAQLGY